MIYSIPYLFVFIMIFIFSIPSTQDKNQIVSSSYKISSYGLLLILVLVFIGFRGFISSDYTGYYPFFKIIPTIQNNGLLYIFNNDNSWELGFCFYTMLFKSIIPNYFFYQASLVLFDLIILTIVFNRYCSRYIKLAFCVFYLFQGFGIEVNLLRNSKSIMFFLLSIEYIKTRKISKYILFNIIGFLFHASAILYLPLYFLVNKKKSRMLIISIYLVGQIFFLFQLPWEREFLVGIQDFLPGRIGHYIVLYVSKMSKGYGISIGYLERTVSSILVLVFYNKITEKSEENVIFINIFFMYQFVFLFFSGLAIIPQRIALLLIPGYWFMYPQVYSFLRKEWKVLFLLYLLIYGVIRITLDTKSILFLYDNYLFNPLSILPFEVRAKTFLEVF